MNFKMAFVALLFSLSVSAEEKEACTNPLKEMFSRFPEEHREQVESYFNDLESKSPQMARILEKSFGRMSNERLQELVNNRLDIDVNGCVRACGFERKYGGITMRGSVRLDSKSDTLMIKITHLFPTDQDLKESQIHMGLQKASLLTMQSYPVAAKGLAVVTMQDRSFGSGIATATLKPALEDVFMNAMLLSIQEPSKIKNIKIVGDTIINKKLYAMLRDNGFQEVKSYKPDNWQTRSIIQKSMIIGNFAKWLQQVGTFGIASGAETSVKKKFTLKKLLTSSDKTIAHDVQMILERSNKPLDDSATPTSE